MQTGYTVLLPEFPIISRVCNAVQADVAVLGKRLQICRHPRTTFVKDIFPQCIHATTVGRMRIIIGTRH